MGDSSELREAIARHVRWSAANEVPRLLLGAGLGSLVLTIAINLAVQRTTPWRYAVEGLAVGLCLVLWWLTRRDGPLARHSAAVFAAMVAIVVCAIQLLMVASPTILNASIVVMVIVAYSTVVLRWDLFVLVTVPVLACAAWVAPQLPASWSVRWLLVAPLAVGLSGLLLASRLRTVRELARADLDLAQAARTDVLTGLRNRYGLLEEAGGLLATAAGVGVPAYAVFVDIDGLKDVNDELGHAAGDRAIRRIALSLKEHAPERAVLARMGGDEFVIIGQGAAPDVDALSHDVWQEAIRTAGDDPLPSGISVGVAEATDLSLEGLLAMADAHMYSRRALRRRLADGA